MSVRLFWTCLTTILGTYLAFPLVTVLRAALRPQPVAGADDDGRSVGGHASPRVSVVIAAHNEAQDIAGKLESVLAQDYPAELLDVVVATDGCTDGTDDVVHRFAGRGVRLLSLARVGKATALNTAVAGCSSEILVFSDANNPLAPDAVRRLVAPFADPQVGGVAGDQRYLPAGSDEVGTTGERSYWSIDRMLKEAESRGGNVISATGALYAVRRALFTSVVDGVTDDFYVSTGVVAQRRRLVFAPDAVVWEKPAPATGLEFNRKVRIMTRGLRGVWLRRELLNPRVHGFYSVQLGLHKVLRRLMVFPLAGLLLACLAGARNPLLRAAALAQLTVYGAGALGLATSGRRTPISRATAVPAYFLLVNGASAVAVWNLVRGRRIDRWETARTATGEQT